MRISNSCYAVIGLYFIPPWGVNAGFIVGHEQTLMIDTGTNYLSAQTLFGYASSVKGTNSFVVINTEKHLDHMGGNSFFADKGFDIYGHSEVMRREKDVDDLIDDFNSCISNAIRRERNEASVLFKDTRIANPNKRILEDTELDLGGLRVHILKTPGHTVTNLSIYIPTEKILYCGDCIVNGFIPNLEEGTPDEWRAWRDSLEKIADLSPEITVPGHGPVIEGRNAVHNEIQRIKDILDRSIDTGTAPTLG